MNVNFPMLRQLTEWPVRCAGLLVLGLFIPACSASTPASTSTPASASATPLWGDMKPVVSVRELMRDLLDPVADNIFNAVATVITKKGVEETQPRTDADWERIQVGAVSLAEGASLLKVRRAFAPPEAVADRNPVELAPSEITAKVERDPVEWNARIEALRNAALEVIDIVKRKDVDALWGAGEDLDHACENCHRSYWYPAENAEFYRTLRRRLDDYRQQSPPVGSIGTPQK